MLHRFGFGEGLGDEAFDSVHETYRSDVEQRHSPLAIHDPNSSDIKMVRRLADELINISGAEVKLFVRTDNGDFDAVWDEDPDPTYWTPLLVKGFFKPQPIEIELKKWGLDTANKIDITFSHRQIYDLVGERMIRAGDVIQVPFNSTPIKLKNYRVINATPSGNFRYVWLYYACNMELLTADVTVRPEQDMPEDPEVDSGGGYKESWL